MIFKRLVAICFLLCSSAAISQVTNTQLQTKIEHEYSTITNPNPSDTSINDWLRIQMLREYSYKHTAYAIHVYHPSGAPYTSFNNGNNEVNAVAGGTVTVGDGYNFFDNFGGGVICGGTGTMLSELYAVPFPDFNPNGYPSWIIQSGFYPVTPSKSDFTHTQSLVTIPFKGKLYRVVSDADMDSTYSLAGTAGPIDYHDMVWYLAQNHPISTNNIVNVTRSNGIVTVTTATAHGASVGSSISTIGITDTSFDGTFTITSVLNSTQLQYAQNYTGSSTSSGGSLSVNSVNFDSFISTQTGVGGNDIPPTLSVGFQSDEPETCANSSNVWSCSGTDNSWNTNSWPFDPTNIQPQVTPSDRWAIMSPRRASQLEKLGPTWWYPQLINEGRPAETIYIHTFLFALIGMDGSSAVSNPDGSYAQVGTTSPQIFNTAHQIVSDFKPIRFTKAEGFTDNNSINTVAAAKHLNVHFSNLNYPTPDGAGVGISLTSSPTYLYFNSSSSGDVKGEIDFPFPATAVDVDLIVFNGGPVTMTAYDTANNPLAQHATGTPSSSSSHLGITAPNGTLIKYVQLTGTATQSGNALAIANLLLRVLGPTIRFDLNEGFSDNNSINAVAANFGVSFSTPTGGGVGLYPSPIPASQPNQSVLYFNASSDGSVTGDIEFTNSQSAVALDVCYFPNAPVTMTAYDGINGTGNVLGTASVPGPGSLDVNHCNRLAVSGNPGNTKPIKSVRLTGNNGAHAAISIKNLQIFAWN